ncbi:Oidioi.mRNA.OKI2018_I69.chr2.g6706.t1.cds [Oikopleura dioica]|uniref:Oidioi.mRNA.OKI2018_I69.chr2.g6706.t1.cds n=1 Tax=Oikopleura dioica TaxID=34765 RepID=A0ABN7TD38_OIKDI|nr:Oidioi.mRNA.OKI2018_I69.chr2.g6706.t1.cds [Oikopleura dioica]
MSKSDPRGASDAKQVFSALNAQLMAELPKLSALAESLFLSSVASLTYLVGQLLAKLNSQHPRPSSENNHAARAKFKKSNDDLWLAIQKLDLISTNFNRPKPEPVLTSSTQTPHDRSIIANQRGYVFQAKDRWISGDRRDLKVSKGDLLHKIHDQVVQGKILVDNGSKKGYVPMRILSPISRRQLGSFVNGNSDSSEQLQTVLPEKSGKDKSSSALIDFETEADSPVSNKTNTSEFFINAKYDFTRRSDAELTVEEGERVLVVTQADADGNTDWWFVRNSVGKSGYVPRSYLVNEADI